MPLDPLHGDNLPVLWSQQMGAEVTAGIKPRVAKRFQPFIALEHPLLRALLRTAEGTYRHSLVVGTAAAAAAHKIGANADLVRVAGYYHDVGKMRNPEVFAEAHRGNRRHLTVLTRADLLIILAHPAVSVEMLRQCQGPPFPEGVIKMVAEHHGNARRFYQEEGEVRELRYEGNPPSSREAAVLMLADSAEAFFDHHFNRILEERKVLVPPALKTIEIEVKRIAGGLTRGKFGPSGEMEDDPQISGQVLSAGELAVVEGAISRALYKLYHNLPLLGSFERRSGKKDRRQIPRGPDRRC